MIELSFLKDQPASNTAFIAPEPGYSPFRHMPNTEQYHPENSFGDFNLIRMVEEHGPIRIQEITKELQEISNRMSRLEVEKGTLERLVAATK